MESINIAIVEDDPVIRESLENYLGINPALQIVLTADRVEQFLEERKIDSRQKIDLLLLDIGLPGMSGIEGLPHIRKCCPDTDIVMLTTFEEQELIFKALCAGACSYITKRSSLAKIQEAVFIVHRGGSYMSPSIARKIAMHFMPKAEKQEDAILTKRQKEIVSGLVDGLSYKMIANKYNISLDTVRDHIKRIYKTLQVNSKAEVIRIALEGKL